MIVVHDPSCCFSICFIWSVHVVDLHNICDSGRVRSFRGTWSWPLMVVHIMDLYDFMNWLGPSIMFIGVLNVCRVRPLFCISLIPARSVYFLDLYKFGPGWVRPLCGFVSSTLVRSVHFVDLRVWPLVGSVHLVDWIFNPWWGPSTLWTLYKFLTHGGIRPLCGLYKFLIHGGVRPLCGLCINF